MVSLLWFEHDDGGGVEPLAVLQHVSLCPHVPGHHMTLSIVPVNLKQSPLNKIVNQAGM